MSSCSSASFRGEANSPARTSGSSSLRISLAPADGSHSTAAPASTEELVSAVGLKARHTDSGGHLDHLEDLACWWIDSAQIAPVIVPGRVPELSLYPADPGNETGGLDGTKHCPGLGIDLIDLPVFVLRHPETPFCPRHAGAATGRRRDRHPHLTGFRIDLPDAVVADLIEVLAVERSARVRSDIDRARGFPTRWVERLQIIAGCNPDLFAIKGDPVHTIDTRKGSVLTNNLCR